MVELFYGEANAALARVYMRPSGHIASPATSISGTISGPHCIYAKTLPSQFRLGAGRGVGDSLAEAILTDPCFWSPLEPYRYTARVSVTQAGETHALAEHKFGIRRLGVRDRRVYFEGKNWVARIVECDDVDFEQLPLWRDLGATLCANSPSDDLCEAASQIGVLIIARVAGDEATILNDLRRLARHAAVGIAVVVPQQMASEDLRDACPNVLLAATLRADEADPDSTPAWAHLVVVEDDRASELARRANECPLPVIARRPLSKATRSAHLDQARSACDELQAELAGRCELVGYCV